jgi:sulfur carrier protein
VVRPQKELLVPDQQPPKHLVYVNDNPRTLDRETTLFALLSGLGLTGRAGVAVAVNDAVVPRDRWDGRLLQGGDRVLVIHASQGG